MTLAYMEKTRKSIGRVVERIDQMEDNTIVRAEERSKETISKPLREFWIYVVYH